MRSWFTILALCVLLPAAPALAGTQVNTSGKFAVWVPDNWKVTVNGNRLSAENDDIAVLAGPLTDATAALTSDGARDFVDDELDDMKVTSDRGDKIEGFEIRLLDGTGVDDGDPVVFKALALKPRTAGAVIEVLVYGEADAMKRSAATVDRILRSLRPQ